MHIGNVYAMLAAWLSAHAGDGSGDGDSQAGSERQRGKVLLRIEDVDGPRAMKDADKWIMDDLHWLGLDWDGEPVYQSQRAEIYEDALRSLESVSLDDFPLVYPCFCSRADLRAASAPQEGDRFLIYPGTCRKLLSWHPDEVRSRLEAGQRHSLRIAVPEESSSESIVTFDDRVFGRQRFDLSREVGDTVIRRSDSIFSYQLAVVVDDLLMGVNDIVRGRDLLRSTALQIWIRRALVASGFATKYVIAGNDDSNQSNDHNTLKSNNSTNYRTNVTAEDPAYAHLPLIDDPAGVRLAKRKRSLDISSLRADGVKPEQIIGYCAWLLGVRASESQGVHMPDATGPVAMSAREALERFTWDDIRVDKSDRILPANWASELTGAKTAVYSKQQ
ncbi:glutamate--tRNA ligase family protein [Bifidobacterium sp. ESL0769]|uniref:glutamate--tRNA ligase family protein n=1 Tax=Bifidobacterium sp. ESL0769 TaxID=2983229 RepID=UPI0023F7201D|nr:glutamate--tRNA ligase family protein [Bifidobacterium sp. ESL0769]WEV68356.1 glutamate--tRNA ligase family protein [Bifidobacterium sp. ESL0769]